jgi:hypothetical protein
MEKLMRVSDSILPFDKAEFGGVQGHVVMTDMETGQVILKKSNLIVLRGRLFVLEQIFNNHDLNTNVIRDDDITSGYKTTSGRQICMFRVGTGGTPSLPLVPEAPVFYNDRLIQPVPFRLDVQDNIRNPYFNVAINKSIYSGVEDNDTYYGRAYNYKAFDSAEWWINTDTLTGGVVYHKLTLTISEQDFRYIPASVDTLNIPTYTPYINELALYFAAPSTDADGVVTFTDPEMFSRITFPTEPLALTSKKSIRIEYYIYA